MEDAHIKISAKSVLLETNACMKDVILQMDVFRMISLVMTPMLVLQIIAILLWDVFTLILPATIIMLVLLILVIHLLAVSLNRSGTLEEDIFLLF